jgi:hypothetical protein
MVLSGSPKGTCNEKFEEVHLAVNDLIADCMRTSRASPDAYVSRGCHLAGAYTHGEFAGRH